MNELDAFHLAESEHQSPQKVWPTASNIPQLGGRTERRLGTIRLPLLWIAGSLSGATTPNSACRQFDYDDPLPIGKPIATGVFDVRHADRQICCDARHGDPRTFARPIGMTIASHF